jgi:hypothetical protein
MFTSSVRARPTPPPPPTPSPNTPNFIIDYVSKIQTQKYLSNKDISDIYSASRLANNDQLTVRSKSNLDGYLKLLQEQLNASNTPPLPQITFFCVSIPSAFRLFFMPDDTIPIPYNKLHATMPDVFPNSVPYTQIQIICILWKHIRVLFSPSGPIIDPRNDKFNEIVKNYIAQINNAVTELLNSSYVTQ